MHGDGTADVSLASLWGINGRGELLDIIRYLTQEGYPALLEMSIVRLPPRRRLYLDLDG